MFRPFGNMMRFPDGRVVQQNTNGVWIDQMTGVQYNQQAIQNMMFSAFNSDIPDGGRGKKTPYYVIGVAGSFLISNWLNDAKNGVDSVDFAWIGDSNVCTQTPPVPAGDPQAFADNIVWAGISAGMRLYGSPVVPNGGIRGTNSSPNNKVGYNVYHTGLPIDFNRGWTSGVLYGPSEFSNQFGVSLGQFSPLGGGAVTPGATDFNKSGYSWLPIGLSGYGGSVVANWIIGTTGGKTGLDTAAGLYLRVIAGTTGNTGGVLPVWLKDSQGTYFTKYLNINITGSAGFTAYGITLEPRTIGNTAIEISYNGYYNGAGALATGPVALAMSSIYNRGVKGIASSTLHETAGATLGQMWRSISLAGISAGNNTIINYLKEYYNRQIAAGSSGRVCISLLGGVNTDNGTNDADKANNSISYIKNIVSFITSEWSIAGLPSDKLTFMVINEWTQPPAYNWNNIRPVIAGEMKNYSAANNITYVDIIKLGANYDGLTAAGYYASNNTDPMHLSPEGYKVVTKNIMDALLKTRNTNRYNNNW